MKNDSRSRTEPIEQILIVRNVRAGTLLETFLVSAMAAVLGIRALLNATGYPQVGGGGLHIAHMLWGGLAMMAAIVLLLAFIGPGATQAGAILGGLGFGTFIDELGKFVTRDNDYFFQPTVALIYGVFIGLFMVFRFIERSRPMTREGYLMNALELAKELVDGSIPGDKRLHAAALLAKCDPSDPLVGAVRELLDSAVTIHPSEANPLVRARLYGLKTYKRIIRLTWFQTGVTAFFALYAIIGLSVTVYNWLVAPSAEPALRATWSTAQTLGLAGSAVTGLFVAAGIVQLRRSRLRSYRRFRLGVLVQLFFTQFVNFYASQFNGLLGLAASIVTLAVLNYSISREENRKMLGLGQRG